MYTCKYETRYGDYKNFDEIKTGTILDIVQDISIKDSDTMGFGLNTLRKMNLAWLMQGINIRLLSPVKTGEIIEASTAVKLLKGVTSQRGCYIKQNGVTVAQTMANWFLFDTKNNKLAKIPPEIKEKFIFYEFEEDFLDYSKPLISKSVNRMYSIRISNKDIDTNNHLNNQKSADILMDALPYDFSFNLAKIIYKKPAFLGDELYLCTSEIEKGFYVHLEDVKSEIYVAGTFEIV